MMEPDYTDLGELLLDLEYPDSWQYTADALDEISLAIMEAEYATEREERDSL